MIKTEYSQALKPSGVPWVGDIPEHWEVLKLKNLAELYTGNSISDGEKKNYSNSINAIPYVSTKDIDVETKSLNCDNGMFIPLENTSFKVAPTNSTLLCIEGGSAGKKITFTNQDVCFVNKLCCFKCNNHYHPKLLYYYCQCDAFLTDFYLSLNGLIGGVTVSKIKQILILVPPLPEQEAIARYLDDKCALVDATVEKEKLAIAKLKEYKQAIITEAVTKG
ncbi:MAG: restriction endonuclease subunit S, partial [Vampirovibrionales bacterium]